MAKRVTEIGSNKNKLEGKTLPKLSEFENDLYYYKRTPFLKLTKDDFVFDESSKTWIYKQTPKLDWLINEKNISNKIGYTLHIVTNSGEDLYTEKNKPFIWFEQNDDGSFTLDFDSFAICNGCFYKVDENWQKETIVEDSFNIILSFELNNNITEYELELFKIEENKIPQEALDINYIWRNYILIYEDELGLFKEPSLNNYLNFLLEEVFDYLDANEFLDEYSDIFIKISNFINENYFLNCGRVVADVKSWMPHTLIIEKNYDSIHYYFISGYRKFVITYSKSGEFFKSTEYTDYYCPQLSFNDNGKLVVTIGDETKTFAPIQEDM